MKNLHFYIWQIYYNFKYDVISCKISSIPSVVEFKYGLAGISTDLFLPA